jgi:MFS family permease
MTTATRRHGDRSGSRPGRAVTAALWAVIPVLAAGGLAGILMPGTLTRNSDAIAFVLSATITLLFGGVGALVVNRQPSNAVGWLLWLIGVLIGLSIASTTFVAWSLSAFDAQLPGTVVASWITQWAFSPTLVIALLFLPLLVPDGRLPSRRWRWALGFAVVTAVAAGLPDMLQPGPLGPTGVPNPTGWPGDPALLDALRGFNSISPILAFPVVVASAVVRYRRGSAIERQQLKWFGATAVLAVISLSVAVLAPEPYGVLGFFGAMVAVALLPVAVGAAILRYRLYAIDRLVSRTIAWAVLTGLLAATFVGLVLGLQQVFASITGASTLAVAASTLVVAAMFQPLRARVQRAVDRRFDRARYDADRIVAAFADRLRDRVDLGAVEADLDVVVRETVAPTILGLWLRPSEPDR